MPVARRLVGYVSPLILASVGAFYVSYADKYFLRLFGSLTDVGLYALAARISSILGTIYQSFNMSWSADRYEIVKEENAGQIYRQVFRFLSAAIILVGAALAIFANDFFLVMTDPEFYPAGNIVPLLVLATMARVSTMFCNFGIMLSERTGYMAESSWVKAIIATCGYLALIPYFGVYGAATALLVSNLVEFYMVNKNARRLYDMELRWGPVAMMLVIAVFCVGAAMLIPVGETDYFCMRLAIFAAFAATVYLLPVWEHEDRQLIKAVLGKAIGFARFR